MIASCLLAFTVARAHGGEDHAAAPSPTPTVVDDAVRTALEGALVDAALAIPSDVGAPVEASLLLADHVTSAPVIGAAATLSLAGPGVVTADLGDAGTAGTYHGTLTLPAAGTYAGSLVVKLPAHGDGADPATDLISVPSLVIDPSTQGAEGGAPPSATPPPVS